MGSEYFWANGMWMYPLFGLTFMISVLYLIFGNRFNKASSNIDAPLDILKKRLARGDITKEEFNDTKKELE